MAYDERLAIRVDKILKQKGTSFVERKMMGGLCYMVNGKMCLGISKEKLMARINPNIYEDTLRKKGCHEMDFTGRPMKGFVFVEPEGIDMEKDLEYWIDLCLEFNPKAKASIKKKKKGISPYP